MSHLVRWTSGILLVAALVQANPSQGQTSNKCRILGKITVFAVKTGAMNACKKSANPVVCAVALAASNAAVKEAAETGVAKGCTYAVKKVGDALEITIEAGKDAVKTLKDALKELKTIPSLTVKFIEKAL